MLEEGTAGTVECQFQVYEAATTIDYQRLSEPERKGLLAALLRSAAGSSALVVALTVSQHCCMHIRCTTYPMIRGEGVHRSAAPRIRLVL